MKIELKIRKKGALLYDRVHEITDADGFGMACAAVWGQLHEDRLTKASSIGALQDWLNDSVVDDLNGAEIRLAKVK